MNQKRSDHPLYPTESLVTRALNLAAQDAIDLHRQSGRALIGWEEGQVAFIPWQFADVPDNLMRFTAEVDAEGKLELAVPLPTGTKVEVLVIASESDDCTNLVGASRPTDDFRDNPVDAAEWNEP